MTALAKITSKGQTTIPQSVLAMITSAKHSTWPQDVPIQDLTPTGSSAPSLVRMKRFTLDHALIRGRLGRLAPSDSKAVRAALIQPLDCQD